MVLRPGARNRVGKATGSLAYYIAGKASPEATNRAFLRCIGAEPQLEPTYAMRLGSFVEPFLIAEYERAARGVVDRRQEEVPYPLLPDDCFVTIDGMVGSVVTEFKFAGSHMSREDLLYRYGDQVVLQNMCCDSSLGLLIIGQGTSELIEIEVPRDTAYEAALLERIRTWLRCVKTLTPPHPEPIPIALPEKWRTIDFDTTASFALNWRGEMIEQLDIYADTAQAAAEHEKAGKAARALVPPDVGVVIAGDWRIARDKRGTLSIRSNNGTAR
jgi:hypothetical protein